MALTRRVKLFKNGRSQAVRIPREFELPGDEAFICREGDGLLILAAPRASLLAYLANLEPLEEEFPEILDAPPEAVEI